MVVNKEIGIMHDDYYETPITQEQKDHALSLVSEWCVSKSGVTPFLSGLLCKVIKVNDNCKGGNASQVQIIVYRSGNMFASHTHYLIPNTNITETVDSGWLVTTDNRPTAKDYLKMIASITLRVIVSSASNEKTSFKYAWWKGDSMWSYTPPINNVLAATYDLGRAFKYGVNLRGSHNKFL